MILAEVFFSCDGSKNGCCKFIFSLIKKKKIGKGQDFKFCINEKKLVLINGFFGNHQDIYTNFQWNHIDVLQGEKNNPCTGSQGMVADVENHLPQSNFWF